MYYYYLESIIFMYCYQMSSSLHSFFQLSEQMSKNQKPTYNNMVGSFHPKTIFIIIRCATWAKSIIEKKPTIITLLKNPFFVLNFFLAIEQTSDAQLPSIIQVFDPLLSFWRNTEMGKERITSFAKILMMIIFLFFSYSICKMAANGQRKLSCFSVNRFKKNCSLL